MKKHKIQVFAFGTNIALALVEEILLEVILAVILRNICYKMTTCCEFWEKLNYIDWESIRSSPRDGLNVFWQTSSGDHSETFLLSELFCGTPPSYLKFICGLGGWVRAGGWVWWWGGWLGLLGGWVGGCGECGGLDGWPIIFSCQPLAFWRCCIK